MAKIVEQIDGVIIKKVVSHHDDRGFFAELVKSGEPTFKSVLQTSYAETYPGIVKAFHWHKRQWDIWAVVKGSARVVLHDLRDDSPTKGGTQVVFTGEKDMKVIAIPPGVAHGYQVLGDATMGIVYHTSEAYDPKDPDEERIPFDDPAIGFDWQAKNR
jgi:dTDP-4-dehydrorhamnose 3,5-epimerase